MQISTRWTWFLKKALPWYWLVIACIFFSVAAYSHLHQGPAPEYFFLVFFIFFAAIFFLFRHLFGCILDVVTMNEDHLVLENRGQVVKVAFSEIDMVNVFRFINPPRVTIDFKKPTAFGTSVVFAARIRYGMTFVFPEIEELRKRVLASRNP